MKVTCISSLMLAVAVVLTVGTASAQSNSCPDVVRECFLQEGVRRHRCLERASASNSCEDTALGALVTFRTELLNQPHVHVTFPSVTQNDAVIVNAKCVGNFDAALAGSLIMHTPNTGELRRLAAILQSCAGSIGTGY